MSLTGGKRVVAVIPARGGSKSIPHKNICLLGGKPLIAWTIGVAGQVRPVDRVIVSTDDDDIGNVGRSFGAEVYKRPFHLATDQALVIDALRDLLETLRREGEDVGVMILLEPTCPFRAKEDIEKCLELIESGYDSAATFKEANLNPHRAWKIVDQRPEVFIKGAVPWMPRQSLPKAYQLNGAVYAFRTEKLAADSPGLLFGRAGAVVMPPDRSVDIDTPIDLLIAEAILQNERK
jgi:CMP-N,N'-diacetyllegionaminic acid synthase